MIVTKFNYPMEKNLVAKLDLMIDRCETKKAKKDVVLIVEGKEGEGKTTLAVAVGYYVADKTGRSFGSPNVFFDAQKMLDFAKNTEGQIIVWDEPALQALSTDWAKGVVQDITRLVMTARKKRHFIIINLTKFFKFPEYIVVDRAVGLIHVYSRNNIETGRFMFIRAKNLENLWRDYRFKKRRNYKKWAEKNIFGTFPDVLNKDYKNNVLADFDIDDYERRKDEAISTIGNKEASKESRNSKMCKYLIAFITKKGITKVELSEYLTKNGLDVTDSALSHRVSGLQPEW